MFVFLLAQKYELLYQLTYIIEYGGDTESESWYSVESAKVELFFEKFFEEMKETLAYYENVTLDGFLSRIMNMHRSVYRSFSSFEFDGSQFSEIASKTKWKRVRLKCDKMRALLEALGNIFFFLLLADYILVVMSKHKKVKL